MNFLGKVGLTISAALGLASATQADPIQYLGKKGDALPFSEAVRAGDFLILSGQIGFADKAVNADTPEGFKAAARNAMDNISHVLATYESSMDQVVKCTVMLEDIKNWSAFNEVYITYFKPNRRPARSAFGSNGLAGGAPLEVECMAYQPIPR